MTIFLKEPVVEANRFASGVSGFPEFEGTLRQGTISYEISHLCAVNRSGGNVNHTVSSKRRDTLTSALTGVGTDYGVGSDKANDGTALYARQCPMVTQPDEGSIPSGSTKLLWSELRQ